MKRTKTDESTLVPLSILLTDQVTDGKGIARLRAELQRVGITVSGVGRSTISARVALRQFEQLFRIVPETTPSRPPSAEDMGISGGFTCDCEFKLPDRFAPYVKQISVEPPYLRLNETYGRELIDTEDNLLP